MKKIMLFLAASVAMVSFSSCNNVNTLAENDDVNVYIIEELHETEEEYVLRFRDSDRTLSVSKQTNLESGMIVLVKKDESQTTEEYKVRVIQTPKMTTVTMAGFFLWGLFIGWAASGSGRRI